jgi:Malectin domain
MNHAKRLAPWPCGSLISALAVFLLVGCQSNKEAPGKTTMTPPAGAAVAAAPAAATTPAATATPAAAAPAAATAAMPASAQVVIRIDAGASAAYTNAAGEVWLADQGFADGDTVDRGSDLQIANTKDPAIYRTEHFGMTSFAQTVPNGKYTVKLHFAETYEGITGPGQRVFSFNVGGHEFKDFDVYAKAGGAQRACVETADADVTDGKLVIAFTANVQSTEINGIEIISVP